MKKIQLSSHQKHDLTLLILAGLFFATGEILAHIAGSSDGAWPSTPLGWLSLALLWTAYLFCGHPVLLTAFRNIRNGRIFDENFLMALATLGALALRQWDEAVAVMLFYGVGELFEDLAVDRSRESIAELMDIRPDAATLLRDGKEVSVDPYDVEIGDTILVRPGERIPLDGIITRGQATLDTSALTGESLPVEVSSGDAITSGCIDLSGLLSVEVTSRFEDSTVARILDLVENAGSRKANIEHFITRFARIYTPAVVFSALALALIPPLFLPGHPFSSWIYRALMFLVISCPCALVISIPLSFFGGIGATSKNGILVKGSNFLEALADVDTVVFDKTGTLTRGVFQVVACQGPEDLLMLAALAEAHSTHPIARSIVAAAREQNPSLLGPEGTISSRITDVTEQAGMGVSATIDGRKVTVGNEKLVAELKDDSATSFAYVTVDGAYYGRIAVADMVKEDAVDAIAQLKRQGVRRTIMLTGDQEPVAAAISEQIGLDEYHAELLPADKVDVMESMLDQRGGSLHKKIAYVGDGINDAPVLARSDVGVAMGGMGSEAAIEAADVVIMDDAPSRLADAMAIARKTLAIARQNVVLSLAIKIIVLALAAAGIATMWLAIFADVGVCVIAILNAMRTLLIHRHKESSL